MTEEAEKLKAEVLRLSPEDRAELVYALLRSLDNEKEDDDEAWEAELERRWQEIEGGKVVGRPAEEVFERLRREYGEDF